jgi:hypothetical protein
MIMKIKNPEIIRGLSFVLLLLGASLLLEGCAIIWPGWHTQTAMHDPPTWADPTYGARGNNAPLPPEGGERVP